MNHGFKCNQPEEPSAGEPLASIRESKAECADLFDITRRVPHPYERGDIVFSRRIK